MPSTTTTPPAIEQDIEIIDATVEALTSAATLGAASPEDAAETRRSVTRNLLTRPATINRRLAALWAEHARIAAGVSTVEPDPKDRRFTDEWFTSNPLFRRLAQGHIANERATDAIIAELELSEEDRLRAELFATIITSALAPTNQLLGNPGAIKEAWRTGGKSLLAGARNALDDLLGNGMPSMVDREPFVAGETVAATPGAVVHRSPVLELLRYTPTTDKVHERPVFVVPPQINKYYVLDLAPGRSLVEHLVGQGYQVFMVSWKNPTANERDWDLDTYVQALIDASGAALDLTGSDDLNLLGVCAGGITSAAFAGHLAAIGDDRLNTFSLLVTVLDWGVPTTMGALATGPVVELGKLQSRASGVVSGDQLARTFAWLRPNDLIWNYWVNNYLMGKKPPAYDVLAWNVDGTNIPAGLNADFSAISTTNGLAEAGTIEVLGTPIDLSAITCESFVVGAVTDHITPWEACYQTVDLLGGDTSFVLSSQGHVQALVNPSGNPKGSYRLNPEADAQGAVDADEWLAKAETHSGSWWDHWTEWLRNRSGETIDAPTDLGTTDHPVLAPAPGSYVTE